MPSWIAIEGGVAAPSAGAGQTGFLARPLAWARTLLGAEQGRAAQLRDVLLCAGWVAFLLVSLTRWTQLTIATQGRLMFPAIAVISFGLVAGLLALLPRRLHAGSALVLAAVLLAIAASAPFRYLQPAYARPDLRQSLDAASLPERAHVIYDGKMELVGYDAEPRRVQPGGLLEVRAWWRVLQPMDRNYTVYVQLRQKGEKIIAQDDAFPGNGAFATSLLRPGDVIAERYYLDVSPWAVAPAGAELSIGLYDRYTLTPLPAVDASGAPSEGKLPILFKVLPAPSSVKAPALEVRTNLEEKVELAGLDYTINPGRSKLGLSLQWRVLSDLEVDYTVFVQALNASGRVASQYDGWPRAGQYPTHLWQKGELIVDPVELNIPPAYSGTLTLIAGLYDLQTMRRLRAGSSDHVVLGVLDVETGRLTR